MRGPVLIRRPALARTGQLADSEIRPLAVPGSGERGAEHRGSESDPKEGRITLGSAEGTALPAPTSCSGRSLVPREGVHHDGALSDGPRGPRS
jgi:hypothetical protein